MIKKKNIKKQLSFTLAEILITLGIIGVVAAMTIPTLNTKTRSQQYRSQFKKTLSNLNQAALVARSQLDMNYSDISEDCNSGLDDPRGKESICAMFNNTLQGHWDKTHFNGSTGYEMPAYSQYHETFNGNSSSTGYTFILNDGPAIFTSHFDHQFKNCTKKAVYSKKSQCYGLIDINGFENKPNKLVKCKNPSDTKLVIDDASPCEVDNASMGDIFPVIFHGNTVEPATNAAAYVLNTEK